MITIIDYDAGNLRSVVKAFEKAGTVPLVTDDEKTIMKSDALVLPGVGAFSDCMKSLVKKGMDHVAKAFIDEGKPFLGICLGYQMLFESSEEHPEGLPDVKGLGVFKGKVKRFPRDLGLKIPHMGWNSLEFPRSCSLFEGMEQTSYVYFVHSYYVDALDKGTVAATCEYGLKFDAAVAKENVFGVQFHPEKSGGTGLNILRHFLKAVKES